MQREIYLPSFDLSSTTSDHHNERDLLCIALRLDYLKREQVSSLQIRSHHNLKSLLGVAMIFDEKSTQQRFLGVDTSAGAMKTLSNGMLFWYVYLHSKDINCSTGHSYPCHI